MVFSDLFFLYIFIPAFLLLYAAARGIDRAAVRVSSARDGARPRNTSRLSNIVLILFSLFFYAWGEPIYVALMLASVLMNYLIGLMIDRGERRSKAALVIGLIFNISAIGVFKYADLLVGTLNFFGLPLDKPGLALPIGISFYTFQSISYLADVYRGEVKAQKNLLSLLLYISLFPQLIAGPIVRYSTVAEEIGDRRVTADDIADGSFRFLLGLGKKVILANQLAPITEQFLDGNFDTLSTGGAWLGLIAYTFLIYFDFSGYSDMAIGLGRCMGFHFNDNFNYPYISKTITEFWRRWHISLGSFFRDYVYIPLGGNRRHQPLNIMAVWCLTGLWHGASWNFALWGLYFGVIIMLEKYTIVKIQDKIPRVILHLYSLFVIVLGWALFYFEDFGRLGRFVGILFGSAKNGWDLMTQTSLTGNAFLLIACVIGSMPIAKLVRGLYDKCPQNGGAAFAVTVGKTLCAAAILMVSTILLVGNTSNPFLYFRT